MALWTPSSTPSSLLSSLVASSWDRVGALRQRCGASPSHLEHHIANIAAARAVDREFNYNFGSKLGILGSGRGLNGRGAPIGLIWAEFQLKQSHGDPFRDQVPSH